MILNFVKRVFKPFFVVLLLLALLFSFPFYALALDSNLVKDEYQGWYEEDVSYQYFYDEYGFDGFVKQIIDDENGCYYFFFSFYDERVKKLDNDGIVLTFKVANKVNEYQFSVSSSGIVNTDKSIISAFDVVYNFDYCHTNGGGGQIFVGFELKNKIDRQQYNYISCELSVGTIEIVTLFENVLLDLYVEPTTAVTKYSTTKKSAVTSNKIGNQSDNLSDKSTTQKTTKFKGSGAYSSQQNSKYVDNYNSYSDGVEYAASGEDADSSEYSLTDNEKYVPKVMSKSSIILIAIAAVIATAGIVLVITAAVAKGGKDVGASNDNVDCDE